MGSKQPIFFNFEKHRSVPWDPKWMISAFSGRSEKCFHGFLLGQPFDSQPVKKTMKTTSFKVSYLEKFNFYLAHVIKTTNFPNSESPIFCLLA